MPADRDGIGDGDVVADEAVVTDMTPSHQHAVGADAGRLALFSRAGNRDVFAHDGARSDFEKGRLADAYADLSSSMRSNPAVGSESKWVAEQRADPLTSASVTVRAEKVSNKSAEVKIVNLKTVAKKTGCNQWTGTYALVREDNRWKISAAPFGLPATLANAKRTSSE